MFLELLPPQISGKLLGHCVLTAVPTVPRNRCLKQMHPGGTSVLAETEHTDKVLYTDPAGTMSVTLSSQKRYMEGCLT